MENLIPVSYNNERILTTEQLAQIYETDVNNIQANFKRNKDRFKEGRHFYFLDGSKLKAFKNQPTISQMVNSHTSQLYLWTERGADRHCKILDTDKAWEQFDNLEDTYFKVKENKMLPKDSYMIEDPIERAKAWIKEQEGRKQLELANNQKDQLIGELKPKADYTDTILKNKGLVTITQISKDYGMSGQKMNETLHGLNIQYKQSGQWLLYSQHQGKGYTHSETVDITHKDGRPDIKMNTKWTQKGRLFLYDILKENGVLPVIERNLENEEEAI